ncbi:MAG: DUF4350 domain-containing protein [Flavobacteriales bacterium]
MSGNYRLYIGILLLILGGLILLEWSRPKELNWRYSYSKDQSIPFGCELLYRNLDTLFPGHEVRSSDRSLFRAEQHGMLKEASAILISEQVKLSKTDRDLLFQKVRNGMHVFIAARDIDRALLDSLQISMDRVFSMPGRLGKKDPPPTDSLRLDLKVPETPENGYPFSKGLGDAHFTRINPINTEVMGTAADQKKVFLRSDWGDGAFYLHSKPLAFTNYYLAQEASYPYAFKVLSHMPVRNVYWDESYKPMEKGRMGKKPTDTPFRFLLQDPSLRSALWGTVIGLFLLLTFGAKRRQRPMPVIQAPRNSTLSYVDVIGRLYFEDGGHQRVARMRSQQFLQRLRERTGHKVEEIDKKEVWDSLIQRTGVSKETVYDCLYRVNSALKGVTSVRQKDLVALERAIVKFWREHGTRH